MAAAKWLRDVVRLASRRLSGGPDDAGKLRASLGVWWRLMTLTPPRLPAPGALTVPRVRPVGKDTTASFILVFTAILTTFAVVIAIGVVYNTARIALQERAWELASLRVLGFTRAEVSRILLTEIGVQLLAALPPGMWLGYQASRGLARLHETEMFRIPVIVEPATYAWSAIVVLLAAAASALIVRRRIDRLDLVSVLKTQE